MYDFSSFLNSSSVSSVAGSAPNGVSVYVAGNQRIYAPPLLSSPVVVTTALAINGNQLLLGSPTSRVALNSNSASSTLQINPSNGFSGGVQIGSDSSFVFSLTLTHHGCLLKL